MSNEKISSIISLVVAVIILFASYFKWYEILYDGYRSKFWVNPLLSICILALLISLYFLIKK